ncbi:MAG: hypothetical protein D3926_20260 [Desulfobacteraceae bacterium]|nr:MAG: hypothetical protein D3926_20260 [Desulfobacteraceae bacterium]
MKLTDIASLEEWAAIEQEAYEKFGLQSSVFNADGVRITDTKNWSNKVCPQIKATDKGQTFICATAHMNMSNEARETKAAVIEECDAGLAKIVLPIQVNGEYLGVAGGCGLLLTDGEVDSFAINKMTDIEEEKIESVSDGIPVMSEDTVQSVCEFLQAKVDALVKRFQDTPN